MPPQISLLEKGPKFCPTAKGNFLHKKTDTLEFTRKLKLMEKFHDSNINDISLVKEKSNLQVSTKVQELSDIIEKIEICDPVIKEVSDNLLPEERRALNE